MIRPLTISRDPEPERKTPLSLPVATEMPWKNMCAVSLTSMIPWIVPM